MRRIMLLTVLLLCVLTMFTGCWNRREIENLAFVMGAGIDLSEKKGMYKLTVQVAKPEVGSKMSGASNEKSYTLYAGEGRTFFEAVRNITHRSKSKLFWSHNLVLIIGEQAARQGILPLMDFGLRDAELRRTFWILISHGSAEKIFRTEPEVGRSPAMEINDMIKTVSRGTSTSKMNNINDLMQMLSISQMSATTGTITAVEAEGKRVAYISGSAAFRGDRLNTFLSSNETRGLLWVLGEVKSTLIIIDSPITGKKMTIEVMKAGRDIKTSVKNGQPQAEVTISLEGNLAEQFDDQSYLRPNLFQQLEAEIDKTIKKEVIETIKLSQRRNIDICGFSRQLHIQNKNDWHQIQKQWDKLYPEMPIIVRVKSSIRRPGVIVTKIQNKD